ncbi:MAG: YggS family pyridoxal phosphate-dependent enzyme [Bacteroidaceae bacterium]|nr:YggS family pyridoxal phosphate-dependent enzyme [Bacteroidaceae bacterium]
MIAEAIRRIREQLPAGVRLLAVSKFNPPEAIREAYDAGQRLFGESQAQELRTKHDLLPADIEWHFIGHLQTNKIKYIAPYVALIHSVDSPRLLAEISRHGEKCNRRIPCLLQLHVAQEETKYGFSFAELDEYLASGEWRSLPGVELRGLMCMASNTDDEAQIAREFQSAADFFAHCRAEYFAGAPDFCECSWGMSGDWPIAVAHGSTIIRVGSSIFGARNYAK